MEWVVPGDNWATKVNSPEIKVAGFIDDGDHFRGHMLNDLPIHDPDDSAELLRAG